jgi:hypothetical protein
MLQATAGGTRPQPNSETSRDDKAERAESGSAGKEHMHPKNEHESPKSETSSGKARTAETLPMTRRHRMHLKGSLCVDVVVTLEASKASPTSPTLEGETMLEAFFHKKTSAFV